MKLHRLLPTQTDHELIATFGTAHLVRTLTGRLEHSLDACTPGCGRTLGTALDLEAVDDDEQHAAEAVERVFSSSDSDRDQADPIS